MIAIAATVGFGKPEDILKNFRRLIGILYFQCDVGDAWLTAVLTGHVSAPRRQNENL